MSCCEMGCERLFSSNSSEETVHGTRLLSVTESCTGGSVNADADVSVVLLLWHSLDVAVDWEAGISALIILESPGGFCPTTAMEGWQLMR